MKKAGKLLASIAFLILTLSSCSYFDEGGLVSKAEKRLCDGTWKLKAYYRNGVNETAVIEISSFTETYSLNSNLIRNFIDKNLDPITHEGSWTFDEKTEIIKVSGVSSIELSTSIGSVSSSELNVLKLDTDEFWYYYQNGGSKHEFHFYR